MRIYWTLGVIGLGVLCWYLFMRKFEFQVNFRANTLPGDIIETIRLWDRKIEEATIISVDSTNSLSQQIVWNGRTYIYDWQFKILNDTSSKVSINITEPASSFSNKFLVPFVDRPIEQAAREISNMFYGILKEHLNITRVTVQGEAELPPSFCVCRTLETSQIEKANGMMRDYGLMTTFIDDFKLVPEGPPIVKVLEWNHSLGHLKFDFCFPIVKSDSLPGGYDIQYKRIERRKALKAIYYGNYITSDRAWYALVQYAKSNDYTVDGLPVEYFYNNPNLGANEKEWKAEVFLPIK